MSQNFATIYNDERRAELKAQRKELYKMWTLAVGIMSLYCVGIILLACV